MFYGRAEERLSYTENEVEVARFTESTFGVINVDSREGELYRAFKACQQLVVDDFVLPDGQKTKARIDVKVLEPPKVLSFYVNRVFYDAKLK
jgi:ubiquitin carboxyl-terminal hydrolase 25/28